MEWRVQELWFEVPPYRRALQSILWTSEALEGRPRVEDVRAVWELEYFRLEAVLVHTFLEEGV